MSKEIKIPSEIKEIMSYLSFTFSRSLRSSIHDKDDLYQDLVVLYLENLNSGVVKDVTNKNHWFMFFKCRLLNKLDSYKIEKKYMIKIVGNAMRGDYV